MKRTVFLFLATLAVFSSSASAQHVDSLPSLVLYQGISALEVDSLRMSLYEFDADKRPVWRQTTFHHVKGAFNVLLDFSKGWQRDTMKFGSPYSLGVKINNRPEARQAMTKFPFSLYARYADTARFALNTRFSSNSG